MKSVYLIICIILNFEINATVYDEKSQQLGVIFKHNDGRTGQFQMTETSGSGVAWVDYNNDNNLDLLIINGINGSHKLYKNTGINFQDVTSKTLPKNNVLMGMGVCAADINQDGWVDFLITGYGGDKIYLNNNGQSYTSSDLDLNVDPMKWSTSCSFADLDNDGDLDLYVARYSNFKLLGNSICESNKKTNGYCNPITYKGDKDGLYLNNGKGVFTDVSQSRGINKGVNDRGFGVVISDFDGDNDMDIYVANDGTNNRLYLNNGKGYFQDNGLISGTAINIRGIAEGSMGVAIGDYNNNGLSDIIVTHFSLESNTFYKNHGNNNFTDITTTLDLGRTSYMSMGWGVSFLDYNNDSYEDIVIANGHFHDFIQNIDARQTYKQENQIFKNINGKKFSLLNNEVAFHPDIKKSSRGLASGDWNNDGKIDIVINNVDDEIDIFENVDKTNNNWLGIKLIGNKLNSNAIGANVTIKFSDITIQKEVLSGSSFMSQSDFRLVFGLNKYNSKVNVIIKWPDGKKQNLIINKLNQYHNISYPNI